GADTLLGYATQTSSGVWTFTFTVNLAPGTYTLFAQAEDSSCLQLAGSAGNLPLLRDLIESLRRLGAGRPGRGRRDGVGDVLVERGRKNVPQPGQEAKLRARYVRRHVPAGFDLDDRVVFTVDDHGWHLDGLELRASVLVCGMERCRRVPRFAGRIVGSLHVASDPFPQDRFVNRDARTADELEHLDALLDVRLLVAHRSRRRDLRYDFGLRDRQAGLSGRLSG